MGRIETRPRVYLPQSDWDMDVWDKDTYQKHEQDFQKILVEYRDLVTKWGSRDKARWHWLEMKGAVKLTDYAGAMTQLVRSNYKMYDNMFSKFTDWLFYKEVREGKQAESYQAMLDEHPIGIIKDDIDEVIADATFNF